MARILVVDDDADVRYLLRTILEDMRHQVAEAGDGVSALSVARTLRPDLILLDVNMPKLDGFAALQELRDDLSLENTRVVMVTGRDKPEDLIQAYELGVVAYISKPVSISEVVTAVKVGLGVKKPRRARPS